MKRGLKGFATARSFRNNYICSNHCPDEKGTESVRLIVAAQHNGRSSNHCPDEKGTESNSFYYGGRMIV